MFLSRLPRSTSAWRSLSECAVCPKPAHASIRQRRDLHRVPPLEFDADYAEHGIRGLLSPEGYNIAWTNYQALMVKRLNDITAGFEAEHASTKQLVLQYARNPSTAALFNHASMAYNNSFFFGSFSPSPTPLARYQGLKDSLERTFGSIDTLRQTMLATADSMFGPGFVWLVQAKINEPGSRQEWQWRVLTTYLAGTPYPEAGRTQSKDMNVQGTAGAFGGSSAYGKKDAEIPPGSARVQPVLCVSTWEHVYLRDFGVEGKQEYLKRWWDVINWGAVDNLTMNVVKDQTLGQSKRNTFLS
ncbi:hypothetical protein MBLNU459_g5141t1 [Dothideomycetes sp. NU459]